MTGRPSGRCAARLLAETIMKQGCVCVNDPLAAPPGNHCFFHDALAVLASPCCVSAADQEQVARLFHEAYERFRMAAGESVACAIAMPEPEPAIALLSAAKAMGREGMVTVWDSDGLYLGGLGVEVWRRLVEVGDDALSAADQEQVKEALEEARESLIEHACRLPLKRRDHGPALVKIDSALALLGNNEEGVHVDD